MMVSPTKTAFYLSTFCCLLLLMVQVNEIDGQDAGKSGAEATSGESQPETGAGKDAAFYVGSVAPAADNMHQVSVRSKTTESISGFGNGHFCSGSLIAWNIVLSAAMCFYRKNISDIVIVMGNVNRFEEANTFSVAVERVVLHPEFKPETIENDIAVVMLKTLVSPKETSAHPIELDSKPVDSGRICEITGWGETNNAYISKDLRVVSVRTVNFEGCGKLPTVPDNLLKKGMVCAKMPDGGKGSCTGDSGGPLVCGGVLSGVITSGVGERCSVAGLPAVVSEIQYYVQWIDKEIQKICCSGEKKFTKKSKSRAKSGAAGLKTRNLLLTGCLVVFMILVASSTQSTTKLLRLK